MARISVPLWGIVLSHPLPVVALVGCYPANKLMGNRLILQRAVKLFNLTVSCSISPSFEEVFRTEV